MSCCIWKLLCSQFNVMSCCRWAMPSVFGSKCLKDCQAPCTGVENLVHAEKKSATDGVAENFPAGHKSSALRGEDCLKETEESCQKRGENCANSTNAEEVAAQIKWIRPDLPSKCTWRPGAPMSESPHSQPPR